MKKFTIWVQDNSGLGTTHIGCYMAASMALAMAAAIKQVVADRSLDNSNNLHILGIAEGDVKIIEWND